MGLDMYIYRIKKFENCNLKDVFAVDSWLDLQKYKAEHPGYKCTMQKWCGMDKPAKKIIDFYKNDMYDEVAYWRKENEIHRWFVENVQDGEDECQISRPLTREDLIELLDLCVQVLRNPEKAEELLPTRSGFFFGGTAYDEWYFRGICSTIYQLGYILETTDFETQALYYHASW